MAPRAALDGEEHSEAFTVVDDVTDEFEDAGLPCEICNDEESVRNHFAVPCRHTACASCWQQWLVHSDKCMICGQFVVTTQRFNESVVPLSLKEKVLRSPRRKSGRAAAGGGGFPEGVEVPELFVRNEELESALNQVIKALVTTKDEVNAVASRIDECKIHLENLQGMSADASISVLAVERSGLGEALNTLNDTLSSNSPARQPGGGGCWGDTKTGFSKLQDEVMALGGDLDKCGAVQPTGLRTTRSILHTCKGSTLQGQWDPLSQQLKRLHEVLIPAALRLFAVHRLHPQELMRLSEIASALQKRDLDEVEKINAVLEELVPEVEIMLVRVESWFDDCFE